MTSKNTRVVPFHSRNVIALLIIVAVPSLLGLVIVLWPHIVDATRILASELHRTVAKAIQFILELVTGA